MPRPNAYGLSWCQGPTEPLSYKYFLGTIRGSEYLHLYLWVFKDLAWTLNAYTPGMVFGSLAIIWSGFLISKAIWYKNTNEIFISTAQLLWLAANFWWMSGEIHDWNYPNEPREYMDHQEKASYIMIAALCWLGVYYLIVKPFNLFPPDMHAIDMYNDTGLDARFPWIFNTWREYENIHILFWLGKDTAWATAVKPMWIIFVIPTIAIAFDFVLLTFMSKHLFIDHMHYIAQFLWVVANILWAFGELYYPELDYPFNPGSTNPEAYITLRWYSSWALIFSLITLGVLYMVWIPYQLSGKLSHEEAEDVKRQVVEEKRHRIGTNSRQASPREMEDLHILHVPNNLNEKFMDPNSAAEVVNVLHLNTTPTSSSTGNNVNTNVTLNNDNYGGVTDKLSPKMKVKEDKTVTSIQSISYSHDDDAV